MTNSLLFLQAPLKMAAVLNCYEYEKSLGNNIIILLPARLQSMKLFIEQLQLDSEVLVLENMIHKTLFNLSANKSAIAKNGLLIRDIIGKSGSFFFTDLFDPDMTLILPFISNYTPTQIQSKVDIQEGCDYEKIQRKVSLYHKLLSKVLSKLYHVSLIACKVGFYSFYTFDNRVYKFPAIDYSDTSVIARYKIRTINHSGRSVIFFSNPNDGFFCTDEEYAKASVDAVRYLQEKGYYVAAKGHPREGSEEHVGKICDFVIPGYIPAEFIDLTQFDFAIGFFSTALCTASFIIPAYSLMNIPLISDEAQYKLCMSYFERCDNKVVFVDKLDEIIMN